MSVKIRPYRGGGIEVDISVTLPNGKRIRERKKAPVSTRSAAKRWAEAREHELFQRGLKPAHVVAPLFSEFADEFVKTYATAENKPSEVRSKTSIFNAHLKPAFGKRRLDAITVRDIHGFRARQLEAGLSRKTVNNQLTVLRRCLTIAKEWDLLAHVPEIGWLKTAEPEFDFLDFVETDRLLAAAQREPQWHVVILTALRTGLRLGELRALRWQDIDLVARKIVVRQSAAKNDVGSPKSGHSREVDLGTEVTAALKAHRHLRGELVFCEADGRMHTENEMKHPLWRACKRAGLREIGWHTLRHTFASHLTMRCVPLKAVQELLGHSDIRVTMRYSHLTPHVRRAAVELLNTSSANSTAKVVLTRRLNAHPVSHVETCWRRGSRRSKRTAILAR